MNKLLRKLKSQKGQGMIEYALAVVVVIVVLAIFVTNASNNPLSNAINVAFQRVETEIGNV